MNVTDAISDAAVNTEDSDFEATNSGAGGSVGASGHPGLVVITRADGTYKPPPPTRPLGILDPGSVSRD
jgi:hypothetical protein